MSFKVRNPLTPIVSHAKLKSQATLMNHSWLSLVSTIQSRSFLLTVVLKRMLRLTLTSALLSMGLRAILLYPVTEGGHDIAPTMPNRNVQVALQAARGCIKATKS